MSRSVYVIFDSSLKKDEFEVVLALDGTILEGSLPIKQMTMVQARAAIHEDELRAN